MKIKGVIKGISPEERIKELERENQSLRQKNEKLKKQSEQYRSNDYNEEYIGKKLEMFYDVIINIKSITDLGIKNEGWPIKWNSKIKSTKELLNSEDKLLKIGILGNGNIGKSFLLSRIFKENIPSGYSVITEGLSLKINQEKSYAILDSAGLQTPLVLKANNNEKGQNLNTEEFGNLYRDKTQTENFIQNLILALSDMLIIVVGKLTFNEQRLINNIRNILLTSKKNKKTIFIVHNLMNFQTKKQVDEYIDETLMKSASFKLEKVKDIQNGNRFYYVDNENENIFSTYHLLMAREYTEAGDYYNEYTYEFLRGRFNDFPSRTPLSIIDEIKKKFVEWSGDLLEEKVNEDNIIIKKENELEKQFIYEEFPENKENNESNIPKKNKIIPKACLIDELGVSFYRSSGFEPPYTCYIENNIYVVKLEVPGTVTIEDAYIDSQQNTINIKGSKKDDCEQETKNEDKKDKDKSINIIKNTRKFGNFNLMIPYPNEIKFACEDSIEAEENKKDDIKNGIIIRRFRLIKKRKKNNF